MTHGAGRGTVKDTMLVQEVRKEQKIQGENRQELKKQIMKKKHRLKTEVLVKRYFIQLILAESRNSE